MVGDNPVGVTVFLHIRRHIALVAVDKASGDIAAAIQFGDGVELVLVQEALGQDAVDLLADATVLPVDDILDGHVARQSYREQVAQLVVGVGGGGTALGFALAFTVFGMAIGGPLVAEQAVLLIVGGDLGTIFMGAVAVGVVLPGGGLAVTGS